MKFLLDMNIQLRWQPAWAAQGHQAVMWRDVGDPRAPDSAIAGFAAQQSMIVVTRDWDFGAILAATTARAPSVVLVRGQGQAIDALLQTLLAAVVQESEALGRSALLVVGPQGSRARLLPLIAGD